MAIPFYDLIFSDRPRVRFRRHLIFWSAWCFYLMVTYLIPTNWIPGWNVNGPMPHVESYGFFLASVRILTSAIMLTVVHMALVYGVLYFILPRYLSKKKNWLLTTGLLITLLAFVAFINYFNFLLNFSISTKTGYFKKMPDMDFMLLAWGRQILFNYPTVTGIALTIVLLKRWYLKQEETMQLTREKINAELQLLKAQVHPHFLFNTLNNIYSFIINDSKAAPEAIQKLTVLLRYMIYECNQSMVMLKKELHMLNDYIDLEKIRYGKNFNMSLQILGDPNNKMICPLLLVPFLENSFKHGASQMLTHPWINLNIVIEERALYFNLSNSKPLVNGEKISSKGLGLTNVKKRLAILYPGTHSLTILEDPMSFNISLSLPLGILNENQPKVNTGTQVYELV